MKKLLIFLLIFHMSGWSIAQSVTFTVVTAPCDSDGVLAVHYSTPALPCQVQWEGGTTAGMTIHTTSVLTDTLFHYNGGFTGVHVWSASGMTTYDTGTFPGAPPFTFAFSSTPAGISSPGTATVTVTGGTMPYSYQWFRGPCPVSYIGTTNPISVPVGVYGVSIHDAAGCWTSSCINASEYDTVRSTTYIPDPGPDNPVTIYPNPAYNEITISSAASMLPNSFVEFYDISGRYLSTSFLDSRNTVISVSGLAAGIYQCKIVIAGRGVLVKKLVVMK